MFRLASFSLVFFAVLILSFGVMAAPKPKAPPPVVTTPVTQPPSTTTPPLSPASKLTLSSILNQILQSVSNFQGEVDNVNLILSPDGTMQLLSLKGQADASFDKDVSIPLGDGSTSQEADLLPSVMAFTTDFVVHVLIAADSKDPNTIVTTVTFLKNANATPLEIDLTTPKKVNVFNFRFTSVQIVTKGLAATKGDITVDGTCIVDQKRFDLQTHRVDWKPSKQCGFQGTFNRATYKGPIKIQYIAK